MIDWCCILSFLGARAVEGLERVDEDIYTRCLRVPGRSPLTMSVCLVPEDALAAGRADSFSSSFAFGAAPFQVRASGQGWTSSQAAALLPSILDLEAPLDDFHGLAQRDELLSPLVARNPHLRIPRYLDAFEGMVRAIIGQQVSVASARGITGRFVARFGDPAPSLNGSAFLAFPSPQRIRDASIADLRLAGLTGAKALSIQGLAEAFGLGKCDPTKLRQLPPEEAESALTALRGIGPWTAQYIRMRVLGDRDAFPAGDLGVRKALGILERRDGPVTLQEAERRSQAWRPWRAYAAFHLWRSLS